MRKDIYLLLLIVTSSTISFSQNWCPQGAIWTYNFYSMSSFGYEKVAYEKDTLLNFQPCKKLNVKRVTPIYPFGTGFPPTGIDTINLPAIFTYSESDTVFFFYKQSFHPIYFFNAQIGDTLKVVNFLGVDVCDTIIQQVVDSSGTMQINNETLRFYIARHINITSQFLYPESITVIEKIGAVDNYILPHFTCVTDDEEHTLRCYQDDNFSLYQTNSLTDCDYIYTGVSDILGSNNLSVKVFPNPSTSKLIIRSLQDKIGVISFLNLHGQSQNVELISKSAKEYQFDMRALSTGIYLIKVEMDNGQYLTRRIVKK